MKKTSVMRNAIAGMAFSAMAGYAFSGGRLPEYASITGRVFGENFTYATELQDPKGTPYYTGDHCHFFLRLEDGAEKSFDVYDSVANGQILDSIDVCRKITSGGQVTVTDIPKEKAEEHHHRVSPVQVKIHRLNE